MPCVILRVPNYNTVITMRLFLLMVIVTTIEVILIAKIGGMIGFFPTLIIIIATALIGSQQLKKQWRFVMGKLQSLQSEPSQALLEALILLICGVLLITPGFLTDIVGFLGLIPSVRERLVAVMRQHSGKVIKGNFQVYGNFNQPTSRDSTASRDDVIEGEFERKDEP